MKLLNVIIFKRVLCDWSMVVLCGRWFQYPLVHLFKQGKLNKVSLILTFGFDETSQ